jgi:hypothetical protein
LTCLCGLVVKRVIRWLLIVVGWIIHLTSSTLRIKTPPFIRLNKSILVTIDEEIYIELAIKRKVSKYECSFLQWLVCSLRKNLRDIEFFFLLIFSVSRSPSFYFICLAPSYQWGKVWRCFYSSVFLTHSIFSPQRAM